MNEVNFKFKIGKTQVSSHLFVVVWGSKTSCCHFRFLSINLSDDLVNLLFRFYNNDLILLSKVVGPAIWYLYEHTGFDGKYAMLKEGDKPNVDNLWKLGNNTLSSVKKVRSSEIT